jgi:hypothetical protein
MTRIRSIRSPLPRFSAALALITAVYSAPLVAAPDHPSVHEHPGRVGASHAKGEDASGVNGSPQSGVRYTCPMHPEVVSDAPGRCPHCGMKLVEQEATPESWRQP